MGKGSQLSFNQKWAVSPPLTADRVATDRMSRTASMTLISHMSLFVTQSRAAT